MRLGQAVPNQAVVPGTSLTICRERMTLRPALQLSRVPQINSGRLCPRAHSEQGGGKCTSSSLRQTWVQIPAIPLLCHLGQVTSPPGLPFPCLQNGDVDGICQVALRGQRVIIYEKHLERRLWSPNVSLLS